MGCGTSANNVDSVAPPKEISKVIETATFPESQTAKQDQPVEAAQPLTEEANPAPKQETVATGKENKQNKQEGKEQRATTAATAATEEMRHQAMKHVPEGKGFLFGQSQNQRKIVLLDCEKLQFSILSTKGQVPSTPNKYQPKDVIFEQSQEMLASNLFNKNSHPPYNFMFITFISDDTIFLCGGVNFAFEYFSEEAFLFRLSSIEGEALPRRKKGNSLVGNKFEKLPCMRQKRYSHMGAFFKTGRLGYIFVFGGRDEEDQLLASCEQYSIEEKKWRELPPMRAPRSTGFSLIFRSKIYVFGGYSADKKRSKAIEVYDPAKNYWETLSVKLHRGVQAGLLFSLRPNEVLLMGGNMQTGSLRSVIRLNLAEQTYLWDSSMKNERLLQKGVKFNESILVFGGDFQDGFEKYSTKDRKWRDLQFSYSEFIAVDDINAYQMATETLEVPFDEQLIPKDSNTNSNDFQRYHIFGDDNFPCILELNLAKFVLRKRAVPMALRLRCGMGVAKIVEGKYLLCGGIDSLGEKPSRAAFLYYAGTNKALQLPKMACKKHDFAICLLNKHVYIFGGRGEAQDILAECEAFSLEQEKWVKLPNLPSERAGAKAIPIGNKILLFGGCDTLQNVSAIDIFDTETNTFWHSQQSLSISAEIKAVLPDESMPDAVYIFSHNEVLSKHFCHHLKLTIPQSNSQQAQEEKIEQAFEAVREVEEREVNVKVPAFAHGFSHNGKFHIITAKGLLSWTPSLDGLKGFESQIVINQVEMLQFPVEKFSAI